MCIRICIYTNLYIYIYIDAYILMVMDGGVCFVPVHYIHQKLPSKVRKSPAWPPPPSRRQTAAQPPPIRPPALTAWLPPPRPGWRLSGRRRPPGRCPVDTSLARPLDGRCHRQASAG